MGSPPHRPIKAFRRNTCPKPGDRSGLKTHKREKRNLLKMNDGWRQLRGPNPGTPIFQVNQNREPDKE